MPDFFDWCDECADYHITKDVCPRKPMIEILKTSFDYTMPNGDHIWVYASALNVTSTHLIDLELTFFDLDGELIEVEYDRDVFEEIEDLAHELIYEGEFGVENIEEAGEGNCLDDLMTQRTKRQTLCSRSGPKIVTIGTFRQIHSVTRSRFRVGETSRKPLLLNWFTLPLLRLQRTWVTRSKLAWIPSEVLGPPR